MCKKIAIRISASVRAVFPLWDTCDLLLLRFVHSRAKVPIDDRGTGKGGKLCIGWRNEEGPWH